MEYIILVIKIIISGLVLWRCIALSSTVSRHEWYGHPLRFIMLAGSYALLAGGAIAWVFGRPEAIWLFGIGVSTYIGFDQRRHS